MLTVLRDLPKSGFPSETVGSASVGVFVTRTRWPVPTLILLVGAGGLTLLATLHRFADLEHAATVVLLMLGSAAALRVGGRDNGAPGLRPQYHPNYYGAFVFDLDGHNVEAVCHGAE